LVVLEPFGGTAECLYEGTVYGLWLGTNIGSGELDDTATSLPRIRGGFVCPARGDLEGSLLVRPTLTIRLI
jgi:hypothetical protein